MILLLDDLEVHGGPLAHGLICLSTTILRASGSFAPWTTIRALPWDPTRAIGIDGQLAVC